MDSKNRERAVMREGASWFGLRKTLLYLAIKQLVLLECVCWKRQAGGGKSLQAVLAVIYKWVMGSHKTVSHLQNRLHMISISCFL